MEPSTPRLKSALKKRSKLKISPQKQKPKVKKSTKHSKTNSAANFRDFDSGFGSIKTSRKFYVNLQETQLMNLFSALKIKSICIKRRYESLQNNLACLQSKQRTVPDLLIVNPSPRSLKNISPITANESHCLNSSFTNFFDAKFFKPCLADLQNKLDNIEEESGKIIENKFKVTEKIKQIVKKKGAAIVSIGALYGKKRKISEERRQLLKTQDTNCKKLSIIKNLADRLESIQNHAKTLKLQRMHKKDLAKRVSEINERVSKKKAELDDTKKKLQTLESENNSKEKYLKEILDIKEKVEKRVEKMKEFDYFFAFTKRITEDSLKTTQARTQKSFNFPY